MSSLEVDAAMPSPTEITVLQLARLVGLPGAPAIVDVRKDEEFTSDPRLVPTAQRHSSIGGIEWWKRYGGKNPLSWCVRAAALTARPPRHGFATRISTLKRSKVVTKPGVRLASLSYVRRGFHRVTTNTMCVLHFYMFLSASRG
jgi:hypothetical protein